LASIKGAHDALGNCWRRAEEGVGDGLGGQAAHLAQRQGGPRIGRQGGVAAGKDQPQPIIGHGGLVIQCWPICAGQGALMFIAEGGLVFALFAQSIYGFEATRGHQPGAWIVGHAIARPLLGGGAKGIVQSVLGAVKIAQQTNERR
jgi:hypothetical protein